MINKVFATVAVAAVLVAGGALAAWYRADSSLAESRGKVVSELLKPAARLVQENQTAMAGLSAEPETDKEAGILSSYLAKIRRDGVPKHATLRQRLDRLAENDVAIVTLLAAYLPHARTPGLAVEAEKFRRHATAWRERWNSTMQVFMAGGSYATADVPFPTGLPGAIQAELAAQP